MTTYKMADTEDEVEKMSLLSTSESSMDDNSDNHDNNNGNHNKEAPCSCQSRLLNPRIIRIAWSIANILLVGINVELIWYRNAMNQTIHENLPNETAVAIQTAAPPPPAQWNLSSSSSSPAGFVPYEKIFGHVHMAKTAGSEINGELAAHYERVCGHKG